MDERPDTGSEWMSLVNKRLTRQERRLRSNPLAPPPGAAFIVLETEIPPGWEPVEALDGDAPTGWVYVQQAQPDEDP